MVAEEGEGWHFGGHLVSNEAKDAGTCEAAVVCNAVSKYGNGTCHCQPAFDAHSKKARGRDAKRLTVKEELVKESAKDIEQEIDPQSIGAGGHGHCLGRKGRG